jgi:predicted Zn-ribbon and HTH transcriptional regulator
MKRAEEKPPVPERAPQRDPRLLEAEDDNHTRERLQQAERGHSLRPGALCPHCGGHAFRRQELKAGAPCPKCGASPRAAA